MSARAKALLGAVVVGAAAPPLACVVATGLVDTIGARAAQVLVPLLVALPFFPLFLTLVRSGRLGFAVGASLVWALAATLASVPFFAATDLRHESVVLFAETYRIDMFRWIETGVGQEGDPSLFLREHALHFGAFAVLACVTLGFGALALGALLLGYMNFYVGQLLVHASEPLTIVAFGWPVYAMVRVVGFVATAVALTALGLRALGKGEATGRAIRAWLALGVSLVVVDAILKWLLAETYRGVLGRALG